MTNIKIDQEKSLACKVSLNYYRNKSLKSCHKSFLFWDKRNTYFFFKNFGRICLSPNYLWLYSLNSILSYITALLSLRRNAMRNRTIMKFFWDGMGAKGAVKWVFAAKLLIRVYNLFDQVGIVNYSRRDNFYLESDNIDGSCVKQRSVL